MKLALFNDHHPGIVIGDAIHDASEAAGAAVMNLPPTLRMSALLERFEDIRETLEAKKGPGQPLSAVRLLAPLQRPGKLLCAMGNYMEGLTEMALPVKLFLKASNSVLDPGGTVVLPDQPASMFQHEAELCVVIGKGGRNIAPENAMQHIFGYTCIADISARGMTKFGAVGWFAEKSYDTFAPMGPWLVSRDEIANPQKLAVKLWVDGLLRQDYNTDDMENPVHELVAWASNISTLEPGDVIACGTNHIGLGAIQDGDKIKMEIESIGELSFNVSDPLKRTWSKDPDPELAKLARDHRLAAFAAMRPK